MKNKWLVLFLVFGLLFLTSCKDKNNNGGGGNETGGNGTLEAPIAEMDKDHYVIGDKIGFNLENYDNFDNINIAFDTSNGVKVNNDGTITARRAGSYTATLSLKEDSSKFIVLEFTVYKAALQLDSTTSIIAVGDKAEIWVYDYTDFFETSVDDFTFEVDNESVAKLENGVLTAEGIGTVTVTATSKYNELVTGNITIRVGDESSEFMIRPTVELAQMKVGEILPFTMSMGENPDDFEWLCDDKEIARVTKYDTAVEVSGVKEGKSYIVCYKKFSNLEND